MKRAFIVMGVPSSGTRLLARILIAGGCEGDGTHDQRWDTTPPDGDLIMIRRHAPHGRPPTWVAAGSYLIDTLRSMGYATHGVIISRDWYPTICGMMRNHYKTFEEARDYARECWRFIFAYMPADMPFDIVSYENLVRRPAQVIAELFDRLGLEQTAVIEHIRDGNLRYYES